MMIAKSLIRYSVLALMTLAIFSSCSKDKELDEIAPSNGTTTTTTPDNSVTTNSAAKRISDTSSDSMCIDFVYPINLMLPDNSGMSLILNLDGLFSFFEEWEENNPDAEEYPTFVFPLRVTLNGMVQVVNSEEELETAFEACDPEIDIDHEEEIELFCFDFVYPITLVFPDSSRQTVNDFEALFTALITYYEDYEDTDDDVTFAYPLDIVFEDGGTTTINSDEELEEAFLICDYSFDDCFTINYPIDIRLDGTQVTINNVAELANTVETYYENNPEGEDPEIVFPIDVTLEDNTVLTVADEEAFDELFEACYGDECRATNLVLGSPKNAVEQVTAGMRFSGN